ncbi:MAG: hypothetical protein MUF38_05770 [Anaerolineae bacterium]|jgi:hypothetical protein|nr:hypothetical protein [Anaerolineae bacterium]
MLTSWQRGLMLEKVNETLTDRVAVQRGGQAIDAEGYALPSGSVVAEDVPARWLPKKKDPAAASVVAGQSMDRVSYRVILALGTDVQEGDRLLREGVAYPVQQVMGAQTDALWVEVIVADLPLGME